MPFFLVLGIILAQHRVEGGNKNNFFIAFKWHQNLACDRPVTHLATHL